MKRHMFVSAALLLAFAGCQTSSGPDRLPARFQGTRPAFARSQNFRRGEEPAYCIGFFEFDGARMVPYGNGPECDEERKR